MENINNKQQIAVGLLIEEAQEWGEYKNTMTNNKAREINSPIIEELINETTPEELAKIDAEMTNNKQQTAKEQAEELIESFIEFTSNEAIREDGLFYSNRMKLWNAKQCALITVRKILSINSVDKDYDLSTHWEEVKQEIENYEQQ